MAENTMERMDDHLASSVNGVSAGQEKLLVRTALAK